MERKGITIKEKDLDISGNEWPSPLDKLERRAEIENLTAVLGNAETPLVFAIDAAWGAGKTTFIKLWQQYLRSNNHHSVYFNAWESDFAEDPLLPMLATFDQWLKENSPSLQARDEWKTVKRLGGKVAKIGINAAFKIATMGALNADDALEELLAEATGQVADNIVDEFSSQMTALVQFKQNFALALQALPEDQNNLFVFVDELDRCRPSYAIEVLERIKHLFDMDGVVFVLAINKKQLTNSFQAVYGHQFDAVQYLRRFVDLEYSLKEPSIANFLKHRLMDAETIQLCADRKIAVNHDQLIEVWSFLTMRFDLKLRDLDQLIARYRLIVRSLPTGFQMHSYSLATLLVLREFQPELYRKFTESAANANDVIAEVIGFRPWEADHLDPVVIRISGTLLQVARADAVGNKPVLDHLLFPWNANISQQPIDDIEYDKKEAMISVLRWSEPFHGLSIRALTDRINLVSKLTI